MGCILDGIRLYFRSSMFDERIEYLVNSNYCAYMQMTNTAQANVGKCTVM